MSAGRLHDGHALGRNVIAQVSSGCDPVTQVVFFKGLLHADRDGFEVAPGEAAIGGISLGENQQILFLLREEIVVGAKESADVRHAIFLG